MLSEPMVNYGIHSINKMIKDINIRFVLLSFPHMRVVKIMPLSKEGLSGCSRLGRVEAEIHFKFRVCISP